MKLIFLFHKPKGEFRLWPPRCVGTLIVGWTWALAFVSGGWNRLKYNYSHVELGIPNEYGEFFYYPPMPNSRTCTPIRCYLGQCFSSTTRGGAKGVRFAPASEVLKHPERWDYAEVEVDDERFEVAMAEARKLVGKKYDYIGLFGFFWPWNIHDKNKWYCSEICAWLAYLMRVLPKRHKRISPRRFARKLVEQGIVLKPLAGVGE